MCVRSTSTGQKECISIEIDCCDNDDPECEDLFEIPGNFHENGSLHSRVKREVENPKLYVAFDLIGRIIATGSKQDISGKLYSMPFQTIIIQSYSKEGRLIETYKSNSKLWEQN